MEVAEYHSAQWYTPAVWEADGRTFEAQIEWLLHDGLEIGRQQVGQDGYVEAIVIRL